MVIRSVGVCLKPNQPHLAGIVQGLLVTEGQTVETGELLFVVEPSSEED